MFVISFLEESARSIQACVTGVRAAEGLHDATWACHTSGCLNTPDTPETLLQKRADTCCYLVGPLLRGIERQLTLFGEEALLGNAMSPNVTAQDPFNLGFLARCVWYKNEPDISSNAPVGCNANTANYMGKIVRMDVNSQTPGAPIVATAADCCAACVADVQCNVWVFCGKAWGCAGCNWQAINYDASLGTNDPLQRFGPYGPGCSQPNGLFPLGTCTLKSATFKDVPPACASPAASDFVSGHLKQHNVQRH
ncbi:hypothetical protein COCOBI_05-0970 [Coccomyxa sp. Obi]|nr:hypothetical protein COCOBI_05-0970 [Coccomyxa sp. Obi]